MTPAGDLLVADTANHTLRAIVMATGAVSTLADAAGMPGSADGPLATARFSSPWSVVVGPLPGLIAPRGMALTATSICVTMPNGVAVVTNRP